jgi:hypothetical protein
MVVCRHQTAHSHLPISLAIGIWSKTKKLENISHFPYSNMHNLFGQRHSHLVCWADCQIRPTTLTACQRAAYHQIHNSFFKQSILIVDFKDFKLKKQDNLNVKSKYWSKKEKHHAT